jgi:molybdenum cofactor cytidylyltransferase
VTATPRTFALIPAAGQSRRMGRPKLSLPLGDRTVVEHVIAAFRQAGVADILLVLAPHTAELAPLADKAGANILLLPAATPDMRATVQAGLAHLEQQHRPSPADFWFLVPADHPTLESLLIAEMLAARSAQADASIFIPTWQGRRGHPALIAWQHVAGMCGLPADQGLNRYLRQHTEQTRELPAASADVLCDLDTPEDYQRLVRRYLRADT